MNEKLIKQLREGNIALKNDGTLEDLEKALQYAFPLDKGITSGLYLKYIASNDKDCWIGTDNTCLKSHSVKEFLKSENEYPKIMKVSRFPINTKEDFKNASTRVVFMEKRNRFLAWHNSRTLEQSKNETKVFTWNYAVDLDWQPEREIKPLKLTMEQIAEKFNAERIEIVNYENKYNEQV